MKKSNINMNMKQIFKPFYFIFYFSFFILHFIACDVIMEKELDIKTFDFPPKLSVTAILDGGSGVFDIRLVEGISLSQHNKVYNNLLHVYYPAGGPLIIVDEYGIEHELYSPNTAYFGSENIRNGEIRLYEDGELILSIPGPFDMSRLIVEETTYIGEKLVTLPGFGNGWKWGKNGYRRIIEGMNTNPGSIYRLEADVEGYPLAVSSSVMPAVPEVTASLDTTALIVKKNVREIESILYDLYSLGGFNRENYPDLYWNISIEIKSSEINNYVALDLLKVEYGYHNSVFCWGIGASDTSMLLEDDIALEMIVGGGADLYLFPILVTKNFDASRNLYAAVPESIYQTYASDSLFENNPIFEKMITCHSLTLRVMNITPEIFSYYQSVSMQYTDDLYTAQPTVVVGNIEGGFGSFSVCNTANILLLDWETHEWCFKK